MVGVMAEWWWWLSGGGGSVVVGMVVVVGVVGVMYCTELFCTALVLHTHFVALTSNSKINVNTSSTVTRERRASKRKACHI